MPRGPQRNYSVFRAEFVDGSGQVRREVVVEDDVRIDDDAAVPAHRPPFRRTVIVRKIEHTPQNGFDKTRYFQLGVDEVHQLFVANVFC